MLSCLTLDDFCLSSSSLGSSLWIFPFLPPVAVHAAQGLSGSVVFRRHPHQVGFAERLPAYRTGWVVGFPFFNEVLVEEVMALAAGVDLDDGGLSVTLRAGALPG